MLFHIFLEKKIKRIFLALHNLPSLSGQADERKRRGSWRLRWNLSRLLLSSRAATCSRRSSESTAAKKRFKLFQKLTWQMTLLPQKMRWVWQHFKNNLSTRPKGFPDTRRRGSPSHWQWQPNSAEQKPGGDKTQSSCPCVRHILPGISPILLPRSQLKK